MPIDKVAALRKTTLFGDLDADTLRVLADRSVDRLLAPGEVLFVEGESASGLFVVADGAVRAYRTNRDGRLQIIHVERAGATIAEVPVFDGGPYPSSAAAEGPTTVLAISRNEVLRLSAERPVIALAALRVLAGRLRRCAALVETLALREVGQRLAQLFLEEARRKGRRSRSGLAFQLSLSREQIAARVGTVREVASRAISRMERDGLIEIEGRRVRIRDEARLSEYAHIGSPGGEDNSRPFQ